MNKILLIKTIILLTILSIQAQESKFLLGGSIHTGISTRFVLKSENISTGNVKYLNDRIKANFGYDLEFIAEYQLNTKIGIQSGLRYVQMNYRMKNLDSPLTGLEAPAFTLYHQIHRRFYLEIPIKFNYYKTLKKGSRISFVTGLSPSINFRNKSIGTITQGETTLDEYTHTSVTKDNSFNITSEVGFSWDKSLSEKMIFFIYPNARVQLLSESRKRNMNSRMLLFGISFGLKTNL